MIRSIELGKSCWICNKNFERRSPSTLESTNCPTRKCLKVLHSNGCVVYLNFHIHNTFCVFEPGINLMYFYSMNASYVEPPQISVDGIEITKDLVLRIINEPAFLNTLKIYA